MNEGATMTNTCADEGGGIYAFLLCAMPRVVAKILDLRSLFFHDKSPEIMIKFILLFYSN